MYSVSINIINSTNLDAECNANVSIFSMVFYCWRAYGLKEETLSQQLCSGLDGVWYFPEGSLWSSLCFRWWMSSVTLYALHLHWLVWLFRRQDSGHPIKCLLVMSTTVSKLDADISIEYKLYWASVGRFLAFFTRLEICAYLRNVNLQLPVAVHSLQGCHQTSCLLS